MNRFLVTGMIASAAFSAAIALAPNPVHAAPVVYDFTGTNALGSNNVDLGQTEVYSPGGGAPSLTAAAGVFGGSAPASNNDTFTMSSGYHLVGNNRALDEQGLGVCFQSAGPCGVINNGSASGENGEIDRDSEEAIQLNITSLYAAYTNFTINADSATEGEVLGVWQSNSATNIGTKVTDITSANGNVLITPTMNYLYFVYDGPNNAGGENVLLHSLTVTPDVDINPLGVPEPASMALLGVGLVGMTILRRRRVV